MFESLLKTFMPQAKKYLGQVNTFIAEQLNSMPCKREEGEYAAYTIIVSKTGDAYVIPCIYDKDDKLVSNGEKVKVTDFLTQIIDAYGSKR